MKADLVAFFLEIVSPLQRPILAWQHVNFFLQYQDLGHQFGINRSKDWHSVSSWSNKAWIQQGALGTGLNLYVIISGKLSKCIWCNYIQLNTWKLGSLSLNIIRPLLYNRIGTGWLVEFSQDPQVPQTVLQVPKSSYAQNMIEDGGLHGQNRAICTVSLVWRRFTGCSWWFMSRRNSCQCIYCWICKTSILWMKKTPLVCEHNAKTLSAFLSQVLDFDNHRLHFCVQSVLS